MGDFSEGLHRLSVNQSPAAPGRVQRFGHHQNAFGGLRLLFATLVIVAHTPEILDGNRSREALSRLFGSISFGDFSVDAFFVISGYLISASFIASRSPLDYVRKRVARIYPGYLCAFFLCIFVVAPLGGVELPRQGQDLIAVIAQALLLHSPNIGPVFEHTNYPTLNGAAWTIAIEFKCYILVLALGFAGLLQNKRFMAAATTVCLGLTVIVPGRYSPFDPGFVEHIPSLGGLDGWNELLIGSKSQSVRLAGVFLAGACFYLFRDRLRCSLGAMVGAATALLLCLFSERTAHFGVALFGGFLILAAAQLNSRNWLSRINNENDISYGVYLYAWPITKLVLWWWPGTSLFVVGALTVTASYALGWLSWTFVEKPIMTMVRPHRGADPTNPMQRREIGRDAPRSVTGG